MKGIEQKMMTCERGHAAAQSTDLPVLGRLLHVWDGQPAEGVAGLGRWAAGSEKSVSSHGVQVRRCASG